jgi:hypothetical protein
VATQETPKKEHGKKPKDVEVTVEYLPAAEDYEHDYDRQTVVEAIRTDAKGFFGVQDRTERDTYFYYLVHDGVRIQNTGITLEQLIGAKAHKADLSLVEEIKAGGAA